MTDEEIVETCQQMKALADRMISAVQVDILNQQVLKDIILNYFNINEETFEAKQRDRDINVWPRFFYFLFAKALLGMSLQRIGLNAGHKDHATVLNGIKSLCGLLKVRDQEVTAHYEYLLNVLEGNGYSRNKVIGYVKDHCK